MHGLRQLSLHMEPAIWHVELWAGGVQGHIPQGCPAKFQHWVVISDRKVSCYSSLLELQQMPLMQLK